MWFAVVVFSVLAASALHAHGTQAVAVGPLSPVIEADGRLGLCNVLPGSDAAGTSWAQLAYDAGARINRWEFRWDRIEPKRNRWKFSSDDPAVTSSHTSNLAV